VSSSRVVYTVGYGGRSLVEFLDLLKSYKIRSVVDVRRWNTSQRQSEFSDESLAKVLKGIGVNYYWFLVLGGFPRGNQLRIAVNSCEYFVLASGFPGSVRVFIASLPGLSGLHLTPKPLIFIESCSSSSKTHHPQLDIHRKLINPNQLLATIYN